MFLDEELLEICKNADFDTAEQIQQLSIDIYTKCEQYYKTRIFVSMPKRDVKIILNKTFNLFDSFVRMAKENPNIKLQILGEMFEKYSFKHQFLANKN